MADEVTYEIVESLGVIKTGSWNTEVNMVSWNGRPAKLDIRPWSPDHKKMGKGLALDNDEIAKLVPILTQLLNKETAKL